MTTRPGKYKPFPPIDLPGRRWPSRTIDRAPIWCSVDLRDGNQALVEPMDLPRKRRMFEALVAMGFREIEVAFPSAAQVEFDFVRWLVEEDRVPDDVTIQVVTQAREDLIRRTMDSIRGARRAIVHVYNATSPLHRRVVFGMDRTGILDMAVRGASWVREMAAEMRKTDVVFEYSPETFTATEMDFSLEICEAVMDAWKPTPERKMVLNLPATVEVATPNVYADQIEWFSSRVKERDSVVISVHTHNDRGCAVAATELALLAGADRVEGTLFGNGERTGNVDLVTVALNMHSQGIESGLEIPSIAVLASIAEECNQLPIHPRHPYAGDLVFTAFSGSHQDAIKKGFAAMHTAGEGAAWAVPYLPIDPADIGRTYEGVVRINSQSGKGGVAFVLESAYGLRLPRRLQIEFSRVVQEVSERTGAEVSPAAVWEAFEREYLARAEPVALSGYEMSGRHESSGTQEMAFELRVRGEARSVRGRGNGPIDALADALRRALAVDVRVTDYAEHARGEGADAVAVAYVEAAVDGGPARYGAGMDANVLTASLQAFVSAVNRSRGGSDR